jgi:hypothetical protein
VLIDVRRSDERALYGAIKGAAHIPGGFVKGCRVQGVEEWCVVGLPCGSIRAQLQTLPDSLPFSRPTACLFT